MSAYVIETVGYITATTSSNMAVVAGAPARFNSSTDTGKLRTWYYVAVDSTTKVTVFNGYVLNQSYPETYNVIVNSGHWDLLISTTQLSDAGTYQCKRADKNGTRAQLTVLGESRKCC